jgi:hypothetical protein
MTPVKANCDKNRLNVELSDGRIIGAPLWWYPRLLSVDSSARNDVELSPMGLHWPKLDEDISVESLLRGEKATDACDPSEEEPFEFDGNAFKTRLSPVDKREGEDSIVDGAYCMIDYRSLIHERMYNSYHYGIRLTDFDYDNYFAAADTLLDVQNVLWTAQSERWPGSDGAAKLWMYGALQLLAVQQEATKQMLNCFLRTPVPFEAEAVFREIYDLRVSVAGHPHKHTSKKLEHQGCTFMGVRESGSSFSVGTLKNFDRYIHRSFDVRDLIKRQRVVVELCLAAVWNKIRRDPRFEVARQVPP